MALLALRASTTEAEVEGVMTRVLVAGATGYLGRFVAREFKERGDWVRVLARNPEKLGTPGPSLEPASDVSIGKFDILTTYTYARALLEGLEDDEGKPRGMVAAIMGVQARLGIRKEHHEEFQAQKEGAEKRRKRQP